MLGYKVCGECGLPITGGYSIGSLGAVHKSRVDCIRLLRAENERLRAVASAAHVVVGVAIGTGKVRGDDTSIAVLFDALKAVEEEGNVPPQS